MPRKPGTKLVGADIDSELLDRFRQNVKKAGFIQYRALEAALRLWISLPAFVQVKIFANEYRREDIFLGVIRDIFRDPPDSVREIINDFHKKSKSNVVLRYDI